MDGTLFDAWPLARLAFLETFERLRREGWIDQAPPEDEVFRRQLGKTYADMWGALLPNRPLAFYALADAWMFEAEMRLLQKGVGALYPGVEKTLEALTLKGYRLFVASNGREAYIEAIVERFGLRRYFADLYSAGRFGTSTKAELVHRLRTTHAFDRGIMVGDRRSDVEAGRENGLYVVGCTYGYGLPGELAEADALIDAFSDLLHLPVFD